MTDLQTALSEIASDAPHLGDVRARLAGPRRRRWVPVAAAAGVAAVALATAAALTVFGDGRLTTTGSAVPTTAAPTEPWTAVCFGEADLSTDLRADQVMAQKVGAVNTAPRPEDWFDICASHWLGDRWSMESTVGADGAVQPVPPGLSLVACVLPDGAYGIFRGEARTCGGLGLPLAVAPDAGLGVIESPAPTR